MISPYETAVIVLHYLEQNFAATATHFKQDAQGVLQGLQAAPLGIKPLPAILTEYVAFTDQAARRQALAARDPALRDILSLLDRLADAASTKSTLPASRQQAQPAAKRRQSAGSRVAATNGTSAAGTRAARHSSTALTAANQLLQDAAARGQASPDGSGHMVPPSTANDVAPSAVVLEHTSMVPVAMPVVATGHQPHSTRKRAPTRRKRPPDQEPSLLQTLQDRQAAADAAGILDRALNPDSLLSLFSGGELQDRFASGLASHISRSRPTGRDCESLIPAESSSLPAQQPSQDSLGGLFEDAGAMGDDAALDWNDLLASIPADPALMNVLEPLVMPAPAGSSPAKTPQLQPQTSMQQLSPGSDTVAQAVRPAADTGADSAGPLAISPPQQPQPQPQPQPQAAASLDSMPATEDAASRLQAGCGAPQSSTQASETTAAAVQLGSIRAGSALVPAANVVNGAALPDISVSSSQAAAQDIQQLGMPGVHKGPPAVARVTGATAAKDNQSSPQQTGILPASFAVNSSGMFSDEQALDAFLRRLHPAEQTA